MSVRHAVTAHPHLAYLVVVTSGVLACTASCSACSVETDPIDTSSGASVSAVTPGAAYLGRTIEVNVSGVGTHFAGSPVLDLGDPAVKTLRADVLSPTSLRAQIEIGEAAIAGPHDVTVRTPGQGNLKEEVATAKGALVITASLKHQVGGGNAVPGGLVDFDMVNVDKDNPFTGPAPVLASGGVIVRYTDVSAGHIAGTALVDALAGVGPLRFKLTGLNARNESLSFVSATDDPNAPKVSGPRAPYALTPGKVEPNEALAAPRASNLYKAAVASENQVFYLAFGTVGTSLQTISGARLTGALASTDGRFGTGRLFDTTFDSVAASRVAVGLVRKAGDTYFGVHASDLSGGPSEYNYSVRLALTNAINFSMKEPAAPDGPSTPLTSFEVDAPTFAIDGAIDVAEDADFITFTPKKAGRFFVQATPVGTAVPLNITIYGDDPGAAFCTALMAGGLGRTQAEFKAKADVTYCVRINSTTRLTTPYEIVLSPEL